jgi:hypothetical protein
MTIIPKPIRRLLECRAKRRAIRGYLRILPGNLRRDFGHSGPFTPMQVQRTIERQKGLSKNHVDYALAVFCDDHNLKALCGKPGRPNSYSDLRDEVGLAYPSYFYDGGSFSYSDLVSDSFSEGGHGGDGGHHDFSGDAGGGHH